MTSPPERRRWYFDQLRIGGVITLPLFNDMMRDAAYEAKDMALHRAYRSGKCFTWCDNGRVLLIRRER